MKARRIACFAIALAAISAALLFRPSSERKATTDLAPARDAEDFTATNLPTATAAGQTEEKPTSLNSEAPGSAASTPVLKEGFRDYVDRHNQPVGFYGKVIDQISNPVPNVSIDMRVREWTVSPLASAGVGGTMAPVHRETDDDGRFEVRGMSGDAIELMGVQKEGYDLSPQTPRNWGPSNGSPDFPVIFKLWHKGEPGQLVTGKKFFGVTPDGRAYAIDLLKGTASESTNGGGDFFMRVSRPPNVSRSDKYSWSFEILPADGGILETNGGLLYQAPQFGYLPRYDFSTDPADPNWRFRVRRSFYLKTRGAAYARVNLEVFAYYDHEGAVDLNYAINPSGSTNLQP
jgi:hypothetical protein